MPQLNFVQCMRLESLKSVRNSFEVTKSPESGEKALALQVKLQQGKFLRSTPIPSGKEDSGTRVIHSEAIVAEDT
eukprot:scaffold317089_cov18-Tisochrysis_lutea.AAC.1